MDVFEDDESLSAETRAQMLGFLNSEAPPPCNEHRNPLSNPKESLRKELDQCQCCWKSREPAKPLQKCSACGIEKYCSKECQQKAWPTHKAKCKLNRRLKEMPSDFVDASRALRLFTSKHRPIITESVARAFRLHDDPTRSLRDVLVIFLSDRRSGSKRRETSFYATEAQIIPLDELGQQAKEVQGQVLKVNEQLKKSGHIGAVFVLLMCAEHKVTNVSPVGFGDEIYTDAMSESGSGIDWKQNLLRHMNEGIVL